MIDKPLKWVSVLTDMRALFVAPDCIFRTLLFTLVIPTKYISFSLTSFLKWNTTYFSTSENIAEIVRGLDVRKKLLRSTGNRLNVLYQLRLRCDMFEEHTILYFVKHSGN